MARRALSIRGQPVPGQGELPLLPHSDDDLLQDPVQPDGTWKVVLHAFGWSHSNDETKDYLKGVPGLTGRPWKRGRVVDNPESGPVYADFDVFLRLAKGSACEVKDPEGDPGSDRIEGWKVTSEHDGACGFLQYQAVGKFEAEADQLLTGLVEQLGRGGLRAAMERAVADGRPHRPVLHVAVSSEGGAPRS